MDAQIKVDKCMTRLLMQYPFWGNLLLTLEVQPSEHLTQTMATDGKVLLYNPTYVEGQEEEILCTDLAHEGDHKACLDNFRRGHRDKKLWNVATDYRINWRLKDCGFKLGDDYLYDPRFYGMDAEEIYDILEQNPDDPANQQAEEKGGCGCGGLKDHPSTKQPPSQPPEDEEDRPDDQDFFDILEDAIKENPEVGEFHEVTSMTDVDFGEAQALMEISQAFNFAKSQGKMPGTVREQVEELLDPKVPWEQIVQQFMEQCSADDFSWNHPDRRMLYLNVFLPGMMSEGVDTFVVCVDTSGSTIPFISQFLGEISAIAVALNFRKLYVIYCDAVIQHVDEYGPEDMPIKPARSYGRGGTDFRPPFAYLETEGIYPKGMVYLTDTEGPFPEPPGFPVLWTVPPGPNRSVEFGEMIEIN